MNNLLREKKDVGVIVCRMQVPYLTESHKAIFNKIEGSYQKMSDNITKDLKPKSGE